MSHVQLLFYFDSLIIKAAVSIDDIIARRNLKRKRGADPLPDSEDDHDEEESSVPNTGSEAGEEDDSQSEGSSEEEEIENDKEREAAFFDKDSTPQKAHSSFLTMNLSRPLLKALTAIGFHEPTPIQAATIPVALMGKDVVGGAVTGSGKTAAFIIPMLERLLYREKGARVAATRCLVLVPTRELAVQCFEAASKLALHTDIQSCLIVGACLSVSQSTLS